MASVCGTDDNRFLVSGDRFIHRSLKWHFISFKWVWRNDVCFLLSLFLSLSFHLGIAARMFDYFDNGVMEELQHRLMHTVTITNGVSGAITFKGRSVGRRVTANGSVELLVKWTPSDMYAIFVSLSHFIDFVVVVRTIFTDFSGHFISKRFELTKCF